MKRSLCIFLISVFISLSVKPQGISGAEFRCLGPFTLATQSIGFVSSFYTADENANTILAGSLNGGLWLGKKSTADTTIVSWNWKNITDVCKLPGIGITAIEVRPNTNYQTIYIGTQLGGNGRSFGYSQGILKTTDGGASWKQVGPAIKITDKKTVDFFKMNPEFPDVMIASIGKQLFYTKDDWKNFEVIESPFKNKDQFVQIGDVEWKPGDSKTFYISTRSEAGIKSELFVSRDNGKTFEDIKHGISASNIMIDVSR
ncbi:MAG: hypothetical protein IAF38_16075, partial [Bacteroidia bacterium]|nr:hypothetical protein [Bacteroidia bacterium]